MFSRSSMPSEEDTGRPPMGTRSPAAKRAVELNQMLNARSLVGGGNPLTGSGQPAPAPTNLLMGDGAPQAPMNALTGMPTAMPVAPPVAQQPPAMAPMVTAPAGQERHAAVAGMIDAANLPDDDLASRMQRSLFAQNALRDLLQNKSLDRATVARVLAAAGESGDLPSADVRQISDGLPTDPVKLRAALEHLHVVTLHAAVHLSGEQQRRAVEASP